VELGQGLGSPFFLLRARTTPSMGGWSWAVRVQWGGSEGVADARGIIAGSYHQKGLRLRGYHRCHRFTTILALGGIHRARAGSSSRW